MPGGLGVMPPEDPQKDPRDMVTKASHIRWHHALGGILPGFLVSCRPGNLALRA